MSSTFFFFDLLQFAFGYYSAGEKIEESQKEPKG
jgi:hypothetical protein